MKRTFFWQDVIIFKKNGASGDKNKYNPLGAKYFFMKLFFLKIQYFMRKTVFWG